MGYVYFIRYGKHNLFKVGIAERPRERLHTLQIGTPVQLSIYNVIESFYYKKIETELHQRLGNLWERGEWYAMPPNMVDDLVNEYMEPERFGEVFISPPNKIWWEMMRIEPGLKELFMEALSLVPSELGNKTPLWVFYDSIKPRLVQLVGFDARLPELKTTDDYQLAIHMISAACADVDEPHDRLRRDRFNENA